MIGILAGMGPKSTGPFVDKVVEQCQIIYGAKYDIDFPPMMIYSCPTPFYLDRPIDHADMERSILAGAQKLERTGVDFIAMPCNTAHLYFQAIQNAVTVPIINMVDVTLTALPDHAQTVALLATEATVQAGIYQQAFADMDLSYQQREHWQTYVNDILTQIKAGSIHEAATLWDRLCAELGEAVDAVVIACTDLNVVADKRKTPLCVVDSSACLAQAVVHKYLQRASR